MNYKYIVFFMLVLLLPRLQGQERSIESENKTGSPFNQSKFVPDISMIVDFSYVARNIDDIQFYRLGIPGLGTPLSPDGNQGYSQGGSNNRRGFNFNYGELSLFSAVDPYFDLFAVLHFTPENAGIEEAYVTAKKLPYGFKIKAGQFLSGFGRLNDQHEHTWDFSDRPLVSRAFFGEEGLNELGGQITWVAPTNIYLMLGVEILNGTNEMSFGTTGFGNSSGKVEIQESKPPALTVGYFRSALDIGDASLLFGASYAHGPAKADEGFSTAYGEGSAIDAATDIANANLTVKYFLDPIRNISIQGEYFYRSMEGTLYKRDSSSLTIANILSKQQAGFYMQITAKLDLRWRIGLRYDLLNLNDVSIDKINNNFPGNLARYSIMAEYNPTEFSRMRLQYNYDKSQFVQIISNEPYSQIILQFNFAIGAHGAHPF